MSPVASLTFCFPAFNESLNVGRCIDEVRRVAEALGIDVWELVFVDDGSSDGTSDVIQRHAAGDARIRVVRHPKNLGYGAALLSGIAASRCAWFFMTDADLQFHLDDLARLLECAPTCDFVQGYRANRADPPSRVLIGSVYRRVVHGLADMPVHDPECSFRLVRTDLLKSLTLESRGPLVPVELVWRAARAGARFSEVGVAHRARAHGVSSALTWRSVRLFALDLRAIAVARLRA